MKRLLALSNDDSDLLASHDLFDDPPAIMSAVSRRTCRRCGRAVLAYGGFGSAHHMYGSATEEPCDVFKASR